MKKTEKKNKEKGRKENTGLSFFSLFISGYFILINFFLIAAAAAVYFGQLPSWVMVAAHFFILSSQPSEIRRGRQITVSLRLPCSAV